MNRCKIGIYLKNAAIFGISMSIILFFFGCDKKPRQQNQDHKKILIYTGCGVIKKAFMKEMGQAYERDTGIKVKISGGGATKGIRSAAANVVDVGGGCRHKLNVEAEKRTKGIIVAWDALVIIVNKKNPLDNISKKKLTKVFSGKIKNWQQLGGKPGKIDVLYRGAGRTSGVQRMSLELIFEDLDLLYRKDALKFPSTGPLEKAIEKNPNAIGITGISSGRRRHVKTLKINNIAPTYQNIATGKYLFFRPLYLYTGQDKAKKAMDFINYVLSRQGQRIIKRLKTVTVEDGRAGGLYEKYGKIMKKMNIKKWQEGGVF